MITFKILRILKNKTVFESPLQELSFKILQIVKKKNIVEKPFQEFSFNRPIKSTY